MEMEIDSQDITMDSLIEEETSLQKIDVDTSTPDLTRQLVNQAMVDE
jgi:hypothetical protein